MGVYINNGLYLQMYGFLRNTQAIYQIIYKSDDFFMKSSVNYHTNKEKEIAKVCWCKFISSYTYYRCPI